jgi:hypothetical protein
MTKKVQFCPKLDPAQLLPPPEAFVLAWMGEYAGQASFAEHLTKMYISINLLLT